MDKGIPPEVDITEILIIIHLRANRTWQLIDFQIKEKSPNTGVD